jgi:hypothetical protein
MRRVPPVIADRFGGHKVAREGNPLLVSEEGRLRR